MWVDELEALGLGSAIAEAWPAAACHFGDGPGGKVSVRRSYGRVDRAALRAALAARAAAAGVLYGAGEVGDAGAPDPGGRSVGLTLSPSSPSPAASSPRRVHARLVTLASGAAAGGALTYEAGAPPVAAQTAYGIEAEVEGWGEGGGHQAARAGAGDGPPTPPPPSSSSSSSAAAAAPPPAGEMVFMDFRRHHTGVWEGTAGRLGAPGAHHPAGGGGGLWGTGGRRPPSCTPCPAPPPGVFSWRRPAWWRARPCPLPSCSGACTGGWRRPA